MAYPSRPGRVRVRSLTDDLRRRDDDALAALLRSRADLGRPAPADVAALAARATTRPSVHRAVDALDQGRLHALEALAVSSADGDAPAGPVRRTVAAELLGVSVRRLAPVVDELWSLALLWGPADELRLVRTVTEILGPHIAGLAAVEPGRTPLGDDEIASRLADVDPQARAILDRLTWGPPAGTLDADSPLTQVAHDLVAAGLLRRTHDGVLLPREVALHLRGGRLHHTPGLDAPALAAHDVAATTVAATAAGAASLLLERLDELVAIWGAAPPRVLRAGGLAVRDLRRLSNALDLSAEHTALLVEIAWAAELVDDDGEVDPAWVPTQYHDEWQSQSAAQRWAVVAAAWLASTRAPHLIGSHRARSHTADPTLVNALSPDVSWPGVRTIRRQVLDEIATLPAGAATSAGAVLDVFEWRMPRRLTDAVRTAVPAVVDEAEFVGLLGRGGLSPAGRSLLTGAAVDDVAAALDAVLPAPAHEILLQGDLTAVAPGRVEGELAGFLRLAADLESRGGAGVYRFTEAGVRRLLDAGWSGDDILAALRAHSRTPVPQPLEYLVGDVARRHGHARVGAVSSYVRSDDPSALDAIEARPELAALRLRRLAPTVLVSAAAPGTLIDLLRSHGLSPVAESDDGGVVAAPAQVRRTITRRRRLAPALRTTVDDAESASLVALIRRGDEQAARAAGEAATSGAPDIPSTDPAVTLTLVREAIADRAAVWIGVADALGGAQRLLLRPERIDGGRITGTVEGSEVSRSFSVHRITGATAD